VIDADQQIVALGLDRAREFEQLRAALPVAREQDHAARERVRKAAAVGSAERGAGDVEDQGCMLHGEFTLVTIAAYAYCTRI